MKWSEDGTVNVMEAVAVGGYSVDLSECRRDAVGVRSDGRGVGGSTVPTEQYGQGATAVTGQYSRPHLDSSW